MTTSDSGESRNPAAHPFHAADYQVSSHLHQVSSYLESGLLSTYLMQAVQ